MEFISESDREGECTPYQPFSDGGSMMMSDRSEQEESGDDNPDMDSLIQGSISISVGTALCNALCTKCEADCEGSEATTDISRLGRMRESAGLTSGDSTSPHGSKPEVSEVRPPKIEEPKESLSSSQSDPHTSSMAHHPVPLSPIALRTSFFVHPLNSTTRAVHTPSVPFSPSGMESFLRCASPCE